MTTPIEAELTLIGAKSPLDLARDQKGKDENFDEHGKFLIVDFVHAPDAHFEYDVAKGHREGQEVSEEEWNK